MGETLRTWADLLRLRGVAAVFETALAGNAVLERVLRQEHGERLTTDLRHIAESLHEVATRERLGLTALLTWMRSRMTETGKDGAEERTRRLDSDAAAVQLLTIHGSKGLEFPVVYLPFVADHFPRTPDFPLFHDEAGRRCRDVTGADAHARTAIEEEAGEDLRLLYVALTRAQSQVVTWWFPSERTTRSSPLHRLLMGRRPGDSQTPFDAPLWTDTEATERAEQWQRAGGPVVERIDAVLPTQTPISVTTPALAAREWTRSVDLTWRRTSYTALTAAVEQTAMTSSDALVVALGSEPEDTPREDEPDAAVPVVAHDGEPSIRSPMADLPVGATFGSLVHAVLEHTDPAAPEHGGNLREAFLVEIGEQLLRWPVELDPGDLADALVAVCDTPLGPLAEDTTLRRIGAEDRMCELAFELPLAGGDLRGHPRQGARLSDIAQILRRHLPPGDPLLPYAHVVDDPRYSEQVLHGYLTGSVDVLLRVGGRFVVVDYKTNWLGGADDELTAAHYGPAALRQAMTHSSYPLQALLYAVVLHRFLRWRLAGYDPAKHFGGVMYLYLRGLCGPKTPKFDGERCGVFSWRPPEALVEALSDLLDGVEVVQGVR